MDKEQLKEIKRAANAMKPQFNLGKGGITDTFIETIENYLEAHSMVKIKSLVSSDKEEILKTAQIIADRTASEIVDKKGFTFVLFRD